MACSSKNTHSWLCEISHPHKREGATSADYKATKKSDCTMGGGVAKDVRPVLGYEAKMDLVNLEEFSDKAGAKATFGTYCDLGSAKHWCVDFGRRTVMGGRLGWLWVFPDGVAKPSSKKMSDPPNLIYTRDEIIKAWKAAKNDTLAVFTRHVEIYSELAVTFCLPKK